jgi:hypothetical protein
MSYQFNRYSATDIIKFNSITSNIDYDSSNQTALVLTREDYSIAIYIFVFDYLINHRFRLKHKPLRHEVSIEICSDLHLQEQLQSYIEIILQQTRGVWSFYCDFNSYRMIFCFPTKPAATIFKTFAL